MPPPNLRRRSDLDRLQAEAGAFGRAYWRRESVVGGPLPELSAATLDVGAFRLLAENLPTMCWIANGDGYIVWFNRRWYDYCGTTPEEMEGWGWRKVHDPEQLPQVLRRWEASIATGEPFEMTFPLRGADGIFRPFLTRIQPVRDASGRVARWVGVNIDIFDQAAAEEALRRERDRMRAVLDGMREGFGLLDRDFRILDQNPEASRMEGRAAEEVVGRIHWEAYPGSEESELGALYKLGMRERRPVSMEHRFTWPDGTIRWLDMRAYPVAEGLAVFWRDVTDRREAEEHARADAERVRLAMAAGAILGTWFRDLRTGAFTIDEGFAATFGLGSDVAALTLEQVRASVHPDDLAGLTQAVDAAVDRGGRYAHQYRVRRPEGGWRWIEANGRVDKGPDGQPLTFSGVVLDIEDRRSLEAERDRANALLANLMEAAPGALYAKDRQGRMMLANKATLEILGHPLEAVLGRTELDFVEDPAQASAIVETDARIMASGEAEQVEEILTLPDGRVATFLSTKAPLRDAAGRVVGLVGTSLDISDRKLAQERERVLAREVDHRARNLLAVVQSIVHLTRADTKEAFAEAIEGRIQALSRAHSLLAASRWEGARLDQLVHEELAPYARPAERRIQVDGPPLKLPPAMAQALALVVHELATNAAKHGALQSAVGGLDVRWRLHPAVGETPPCLEFDWSEHGGPPAAAPQVQGFGSVLIRSSVERQLGGKLRLDWAPRGLTASMRIPAPQVLPAEA